MIIKHIHIDNFGKFSNYDLDLDNEFTVLYGDNEDGKSTLMAFIQMMFYGYNKRLSDILRNPRKRYKPWNGQEMKGYIEFEASGVNFRLERSFGGSNATDKISSWNLDKGEQVRLPRDQDPGQVYFNMGAEAFEKSVFIGQSGSVIGAEEASGEITQRLLNLVTTGSEDISHKKIEQRLQSALESMVSRGKGKGILVEQRSKLEQLKNQRIEAEQDEAEKASIVRRISHLAEERRHLELEKRQLEENIRIFELLDQRNDCERALKNKSNLAQLVSRQESLKSDLLRDGGPLDETYIKDVEKQINELEQIEYRLQQAESELDQARSAKPSLLDVDNRLASEGSEQATPEQEYELASRQVKLQEEEVGRYAETIAGLEQKLEHARQDTAEAQRGIYGAEAALNAAAEAEQALTETYEQRIRYAKDRLAEAQKPQEIQVQTPAAKSIAGPLAAALVIIAAGVVSGVLIHPLLYLIILAAILPLIQIIRPAQRQTKTVMTTDNQLISQLAERLKQEQDEYTAKLAQAQEKIAGARQILSEIRIRFEQRSATEKETEAILEQSRLSAKKAESEYNVQLRQLEKIRIQNDAVEKIETRVNEISVQYTEKYSSLLAAVSRFRPVNDKGQAQEAIDQLRRMLTEIEYAAITIGTYEERQNELEKSHTDKELRKQLQLLQNKINQLAPAGLPESFNEEQLESVQIRIRQLGSRISGLGEQIASEEASVHEKYRKKKNISQIENEIEQVRDILARQESDYEALLEASKVLEESFDELQKNFGPLVNDKTAEIFSRLTGGKYSKVRVSRSFDIMIEDGADNRLHEWSFLSSGTIDQAYLSLRLAIAELVSDEQASLPLMLDDVFSQYDDGRALYGMRFMAQYRADKKPPMQVLLFTCHRRIVNWAENELENVRVRTIV